MKVLWIISPSELNNPNFSATILNLSKNTSGNIFFATSLSLLFEVDGFFMFRTTLYSIFLSIKDCSVFWKFVESLDFVGYFGRLPTVIKLLFIEKSLR